MRSAVLGAFYPDNSNKRHDYVAASTRMTHSDPRAEIAARAVTETAALIVSGQVEKLLSMLPTLGDSEEWRSICTKLAEADGEGFSVAEFAESLGLARGVTGYAFHTVPVALYAFLRHPDNFCEALTSALDCGGDTDTVGAIAGALVGANVGIDGIPSEWLDRILDWPRSVSLLKDLARELSLPAGMGKPVCYFWPATIPRNLCFLAVVLAHGFRRLLPPY